MTGLFNMSKGNNNSAPVVSIAAARDTKRSASNIGVDKLLAHLMGEKPVGKSEAEIQLHDMLKHFAETENGEFDADEFEVVFEGEVCMIVIHGTLDEDDNIFFQARQETFEPRFFTCGDLKPNMKQALESLASKCK